MDIHVPRKAITSLKELLRELAIITAGILIALSFDGLVQESGGDRRAEFERA